MYSIAGVVLGIVLPVLAILTVTVIVLVLRWRHHARTPRLRTDIARWQRTVHRATARPSMPDTFVQDTAPEGLRTATDKAPTPEGSTPAASPTPVPYVHVLLRR